MCCMCEWDVLLLCKLIVYKTADIAMPVKKARERRKEDIGRAVSSILFMIFTLNCLSSSRLIYNVSVLLIENYENLIKTNPTERAEIYFSLTR